MAIVKPENMDFSDKNIIMIISGTPGVGKTTLSLSAPGVLLIDADNGMCRVNVAHRKDASICKTFKEVKADVAAAKGMYKTIVIDTGGALIEMIKQHILDHPEEYPGGAKKSGGISQQGFGMVKQLFLEFSAALHRDFNVVYLFHEQKSKDDDVTVYDIICEGSAKTLVYQPADLAAHLFIQNGKRILGFTPTEQYFAKSAYGIKGLVQIPELGEGEPNEFLTKLFAQIRENLKKETAELGPQQEKYDKIMADMAPMIQDVNTPEDVNTVLGVINKIEHALTSKKELQAMVKARCKELNIVWDAKEKVWKYGGK